MYVRVPPPAHCRIARCCACPGSLKPTARPRGRFLNTNCPGSGEPVGRSGIIQSWQIAVTSRTGSDTRTRCPRSPSHNVPARPAARHPVRCGALEVRLRPFVQQLSATGTAVATDRDAGLLWWPLVKTAFPVKPTEACGAAQNGGASQRSAPKSSFLAGVTNRVLETVLDRRTNSKNPAHRSRRLPCPVSRGAATKLLGH